MCRLFSCIPIFRGLFWLKVRKECVYVIMLKIVLVLVRNMFFGLKKGISELSRWVAQKHTASQGFKVAFRLWLNSHSSVGVFLRVCSVHLKHPSAELNLVDYICEKNIIVFSFICTTLTLFMCFTKWEIVLVVIF